MNKFDNILGGYFILEIKNPMVKELSHLLKFYSVITVDRKPLANFPEYSINLQELKNSSKKSGIYEILTCNCGDPGCIGINEGIKVKHEGDYITWIISSPKPLKVFNFRKDNYTRVVDFLIKNFLAYLKKEYEHIIEREICILPSDFDASWDFVEEWDRKFFRRMSGE